MMEKKRCRYVVEAPILEGREFRVRTNQSDRRSNTKDGPGDTKIALADVERHNARLDTARRAPRRHGVWNIRRSRPNVQERQLPHSFPIHSAAQRFEHRACTA